MQIENFFLAQVFENCRYTEEYRNGCNGISRFYCISKIRYKPFFSMDSLLANYVQSPVVVGTTHYKNQLTRPIRYSAVVSLFI